MISSIIALLILTEVSLLYWGFSKYMKTRGKK